MTDFCPKTLFLLVFMQNCCKNMAENGKKQAFRLCAGAATAPFLRAAACTCAQAKGFGGCVSLPVEGRDALTSRNYGQTARTE